MTGMPKRRLPHVQVERNRHGNIRYYFRAVRGGPRIRLPDDYNTDPKTEFMQAYNAALRNAPAPKPVRSRHNKNTLG